MNDQERSNRKQRRLYQQDAREIDNAIRDLLDKPGGRKFLWWLLTIGGIGGQPYANNALATSFNCGELNIGNQVLARIIQVEPAGYARMIMEKANDDRERYGNSGDSSDDGDDGNGSGDGGDTGD